MSETIFSKIIRGEIPSHRVHEDERVYAFLDINPLSRGHTLVVPKTGVATLGELPEEDAAAIGRVLPRICRAVCAATGASDYNVLQNNGARAGQEVMHVHVHVIPCLPGDPGGSGLEKRWNPTQADSDELAALAGRIAEAM